MDPDATLMAINDSILCKDFDNADEHCEYLTEWLDKGGREPNWGNWPEATEYFYSLYPEEY